MSKVIKFPEDAYIISMANAIGESIIGIGDEMKDIQKRISLGIQQEPGYGDRFLRLVKMHKTFKQELVDLSKRKMGRVAARHVDAVILYVTISGRRR